MSSGIVRKLNFTDRVRIPRSAIDIVLRREEGVLAFDARLRLAPLGLPEDGRVFIEASYRSSYMRFDFGTVGHIEAPPNRRLTEIFSASTVHFRVKVVDHTREFGALLAVADELTLHEQQDAPGTTIPILPVSFSDLGERIWNVDFGATGPMLELNSRIEDIAHVARRDDRFFALVYPAAVKEILTNILRVEQYAEDDEEHWAMQWFRWCRQFVETPPPGDRDEAAQWIEDVVSAFATRYALLRRFATVESE